MRGYFTCQDLGSHALKGLAAPLQGYRILGESAAQSRLEVAEASGFTPLVGRENVEAEVCTECGERYFHATTLDELERYRLAAHDVKERIQVEVVSL